MNFLIFTFKLILLLFVDGQLDVTFHNGQASVLNDGRYCDGAKQTGCDAYIKIYLDDEIDSTIKPSLDKYSPGFKIKYVSPIVRNSTKIKIELIHRSHGHSDELMESWSFNSIAKIASLKRLHGKLRPNIGRNQIFFGASWIRMPDYES